jgi:hypothetical protein
MAGLEQQLTPELEASVTGAKSFTLKSDAASFKVADLAGSLTSGSSANWPPVGWAVRYRSGEAAAREQWRRFFVASRQTFMGTEMFSTIYWWGHTLPVAAVAECAERTGDAEVAADAYEWLRYYFGVLELLRDPVSGIILTVGMRSGGHEPEAAITWLGWLRALAHGEELGTWEAQAKKLKLGMRQRWEYRTAKALQGTLAKAVGSTEPLPAYGLMTPLHILQTEDGKAAWCEQNVNHNTTPLMAAAALSGKEPTFLPEHGGIRFRKPETATCVQTGDRLVYDSDIQGHQEMPIPGGAVVKEIVLGTAGAPVETEPTPDKPVDKPVEPPVDKPVDKSVDKSVEPPPPPPGPNLAAVADLIAGLLLPKKQKDLQDRIVAELRNGPQRPLSAVADEVATFGINPDQPQGKPWQEAIRLLRTA